MTLQQVKIEVFGINEWFAAQIRDQIHKNFCFNILVWKKPAEGFMKLNIDGSRFGQNGKIATGGVIRNSFGHWMCGFQANLGVGEVLDAETWGPFHGLKLAVDCNITNLVVESDSAILVNSLLTSNNDLHPLGSLISCCKNLMQYFQSLSIHHIYRECNMVADALTKNAINNEYGVILLHSIPCYAAQAYFEDFGETPRIRKVACNQPG